MFKVKLITEELTEKELVKVNLAAQKMEMVFNQPEFKDFILNYSYNSSYTTGHLWWKKTYYTRQTGFASTDLSRDQIYQKLMSGREDLSSEMDQEADIFLRVDRSNRRGVIGYTSPSTKWQTIYGWALSRYSIDFITGNLAHEWCHKVGFAHDYYSTASRPYSVPYAVGDFVANFKL